MRVILFFAMLLISYTMNSQVGIATTSPKAMLDVNGNLSIRTVNSGSISEVETAVLIVDATDDSIVKKVSSKDVVNSYLKSLVKGSLQATSTLDIALLGTSSQKLDFDNEEFDLNNEYDVVTNEFTPKQNGYYEISSTINIKPDPIGITASTNVSLQILKNASIIAESSGPLVGATLGLVNVYVLPIRTVNTVVFLTTADTISFHIKNGDGLANIDIDLQAGENGFFYIKQIR